MYCVRYNKSKNNKEDFHHRNLQDRTPGLLLSRVLWAKIFSILEIFMAVVWFLVARGPLNRIYFGKTVRLETNSNGNFTASIPEIRVQFDKTGCLRAILSSRIITLI